MDKEPNTKTANQMLLMKRLVLSSCDVWQVDKLAYAMLERGLFVDGDTEWSLVCHDPIYRACVESLAVSYARPFVTSRTETGSLPVLPARMTRSYDPEEQAMHQRLMDLRNQVFGHKDAVAHHVEIRNKGRHHETLISGRVQVILSSEHLWRVVSMTRKLSSSIQAKEKELRKAILRAGVALESI